MLEGRYYSSLIAAAAPLFVEVEYFTPDGEEMTAEMYSLIQSGKLAFRKECENYWSGVICSLVER